MSSQRSNERKPNRLLSHFKFTEARQLLRANTQRAAKWLKKPSFPRFKSKSGSADSSPRSSSSHSSPYSHSSSTDNASLSGSVQSFSPTLVHVQVPETTSPTYNTRRLVRTSPVIIPVMPVVRLQYSCSLTVLEADHHCFIFSSGSSPISPYHHHHRSTSVMGSMALYTSATLVLS